MLRQCSLNMPFSYYYYSFSISLVSVFFFIYSLHLICTIRLNWSSITTTMKISLSTIPINRYSIGNIRECDIQKNTFFLTLLVFMTFIQKNQPNKSNAHQNNSICQVSDGWNVEPNEGNAEESGILLHRFLPLRLHSAIPATGRIVIDAFHISRIFASDPFRCFYFLQENYINKRREKKVIFVPQ